jgi:hypothetical protein
MRMKSVEDFENFVLYNWDGFEKLLFFLSDNASAQAAAASYAYAASLKKRERSGCCCFLCLCCILENKREIIIMKTEYDQRKYFHLDNTCVFMLLLP